MIDNEEPSVLDYVKSILMPWKGKKIVIPAEPLSVEGVPPVTTSPVNQEDAIQNGQIIEPGIYTTPGIMDLPETQTSDVVSSPFVSSTPWRMLLGLTTALIAQRFLEPPNRHATLAIILYLATIALVVWSLISKEFPISTPRREVEKPFSFDIKNVLAVISLILAVIAYWAFHGNKFTTFNLFFWLLALGCLLWALWIHPSYEWWKKTWNGLSRFVKNPTIHIKLSSWLVLAITTVAVITFYRIFLLDKVPGEMFSDHAEKLLDVSDVLNGQYSIFFPRNTGREAFQMYLTAAVVLIFKSGLSYMSLKIGTALAGLLTLPYIYMLGKEFGNRWVGLLALLLAGIAYWPNLIARIGLRFPLYPLFAAPALYYLIRGLRTQNRNYFLLSGLALGVGLHGYSPFRIVPLVIVAAVTIYMLHGQSKGKRMSALWGLILIAIVSFVVFLPLMRYMQESPEMFSYRALTRLGTTERDFPAPLWYIFFTNLWKSAIMPFWDNGNIWVHSVTGRPALDVVTAALYFIGTVVLVFRYIQKRHWLDLFMLISVPMLMMPSILSLAFPDENPSLNRSSGAIIPVFIIAAVALEWILSALLMRAKSLTGKGLVGLLVLVLLMWSLSQNYDLIFQKFNNQFMAGAWNTTEIGQVIRGFADSVGTPDTAYVVPYPYWVDTRLVGINAGYPLKDYALWPENFTDTLSDPRTKLFILKEDDGKDLQFLQQLYPYGVVKFYIAQHEGKNFIEFLVPGIE